MNICKSYCYHNLSSTELLSLMLTEIMLQKRWAVNLHSFFFILGEFTVGVFYQCTSLSAKTSLSYLKMIAITFLLLGCEPEVQSGCLRKQFPSVPMQDFYMHHRMCVSFLCFHFSSFSVLFFFFVTLPFSNLLDKELLVGLELRSSFKQRRLLSYLS